MDRKITDSNFWVRMLQLDKQAHFLSGYGIVLTVSLFVNLVWGIAICIIAAVMKEFYDSRNSDKHTADVYDAVATIVGGIIGGIVVVLLQQVT